MPRWSDLFRSRSPDAPVDGRAGGSAGGEAGGEAGRAPTPTGGRASDPRTAAAFQAVFGDDPVRTGPDGERHHLSPEALIALGGAAGDSGESGRLALVSVARDGPVIDALAVDYLVRTGAGESGAPVRFDAAPVLLTAHRGRLDDEAEDAATDEEGARGGEWPEEDAVIIGWERRDDLGPRPLLVVLYEAGHGRLVTLVELAEDGPRVIGEGITTGWAMRNPMTGAMTPNSGTLARTDDGIAVDFAIGSPARYRREGNRLVRAE